MHRLLILFLAMLLCPFHALAAIGNPSELATISQMDERFLPEEYDYWGVSFQYSGCGPATIVNALIASWGITDEDIAVGLTQDVIALTTHRSIDNTVIFENLSFLSGSLSAYNLPVLQKQLANWDGSVRFIDASLTLQDVRDAENSVTTAPCLLIGSVAQETRWEFLFNCAGRLYYEGFADATICLAMAAVGANLTPAPFASGEAGHYVCIYIPVREFWEEGTLYLIDSMPRALEGETFGQYNPEADYQFPYLFNRYSTQSYLVKDFLSTCQVERVSPTILRIDPITPLSGGIYPPYTAVQEAYLAYLETLGLCNGGKAFIYLPMP